MTTEPTPAECPPGVHSMFDFCPGGCTLPVEDTAPEPAPAFTWAESVASYGIGPTATVDIDVHAPGHDEPVPVEIPLAKARELYAMLGGVLAEHGVTPRTARLRERLERAHTEAFKLSCQITDLRCELTDERTRAEQAEAALARVRAECQAIGTDVCNAATRILAALDGPAGTPNGDAP